MNVKVSIIGRKNHISSTLQNWREQGIPFIIFVRRDDELFVSSSRYLVYSWKKYMEKVDESSWTGLIRKRDLELAKLTCVIEFLID